MAFDVNKVKERLQKLQSKSSSEKIDYKKLFFKPQLGKQTIRIVPNKFNKNFAFTEVIYHNQNVFKKSIYSLENWGEKDPVTLLRKELFNDSDSETKEMSEDTAKKLVPRTKAYANVIVRGRESEGVLLWEMNKTTYESVLTIMSQDDEYGDITDIMEGTDLVVEGYSDSITIGKKKVDYIAVNITPKRKTSPLSEDEKLIEKWLENQKNPLELYKKYSFQEIKDLLKVWLDPESAETTTASSEETDKDEAVEETPKEEAPKPKKEVAKTSTKKVDKKVETSEDEDEDDLPFVPSKTESGLVKKGGSTAKNSKEKFAEMFDDEDDE